MSYLEERLQAEVCLACGIKGSDGRRPGRRGVKGDLALQETLKATSSHPEAPRTRPSCLTSLSPKQIPAPRHASCLVSDHHGKINSTVRLLQEAGKVKMYCYEIK